MNRHIKIMTIVLALAMAVATLVSCGMSNDPKKTKEALEEKNYTVEAIIGDNDLDAQAELDSMSDEMHITAGELVAVISATKGNVENDLPENFIYIYYFKDSKTANKFWDENQEDIGNIKSEYKDAEGFEVKKEGSVVYFGTAQAIKDAK